MLVIASGLAVTLFFTKKMRQSNRLGTLIASGMGICGVTAIMAVSPVLKAKDNEISYAVENITIFGLVGRLFYPYLANFFEDNPIKAGLFLGTAIHDTDQVNGAVLIYNQMYDVEKVVGVVTVTKLTRNLFIIAVIQLVSYLFFKNNIGVDNETEQILPKWYQLVPLFVVGLSTDLKMFKKLGIKSFYIGLITVLSVGIVSFTLVSLFGGLINILKKHKIYTYKFPFEAMLLVRLN